MKPVSKFRAPAGHLAITPKGNSEDNQVLTAKPKAKLLLQLGTAGKHQHRVFSSLGLCGSHCWPQQASGKSAITLAFVPKMGKVLKNWEKLLIIIGWTSFDFLLAASGLASIFSNQPLYIIICCVIDNQFTLATS